MRVVFGLLAILGATAMGFFGRDFLHRPVLLTLPFADRSFRPSTMDLGCDVVTEGTAYEDRLDSTANARAAKTQEKVALKISADRKSISLLYAYDVGNDATDPIQLRVSSDTASYVIASGPQLVGQTSVILDVKTWKAVVNYTGQGILGIKGSSYLMQCH